MLRKLIPFLFAPVGLGLGLGAGIYLRAAPQPPEAAAADSHAAPAESTESISTHAAKDDTTAAEYVKLNNQFVVPVLKDGKVVSMVVLALSLEVTKGGSEQVFAREPKLRDAILQVLFDHANSGGFAGAFTDGANLVLLRKALLEVAQKTLGPMVVGVLISDIARQDN